MADPVVPIAPWPLGIDNVSSPKDGVFQPASKSKPEPPRLLDGQNIDITRTGGVSRRPGWAKRLALTSAHSGAAVGGKALLVNDGSLCRAALSDSPGLSPLVSGIVREVSYVEAEGLVWWIAGDQRGVISSVGSSHWGLRATDPPALSVGVGQLRPGGYLVAVEAVDINGLPSGVREYAQIRLPAGGGIAVSPVGIDPNAATLRVYCSDTDGEELFFIKEAPVGSVLIDQVERSTFVCNSLGLYAPPPGELVSYINGRWLIASGDTLFWSLPLAPHHFRLELDAMQFPAPIQMIAPQIDGFYLATTEPKTYWIAGTQPGDWRRAVVDTAPVAFGSPKIVQGHKLPWLQFDGLVQSWMTRNGPAFGLPGGMIKLPTSGRTAIDGYDKAAFAFREQNGLRQILMGLRDKSATDRYGVSDTMIAERIPGPGNV